MEIQHSLMLSLRDLRGLLLRRLPPKEPYRMIFGSLSWRQTWPNHEKNDAWRLTAEAPEVRLGY